jgi:AraC-like DNA-binding protein
MLNTAKNATFQMCFKMSSPSPGRYEDCQVNLLSYKVSGITEYIQDGRSIVTSHGKVIFMPYGSTFTTRIIEPGEYIELRYTSSILPDPQVRLYTGFNIREMEAAFRRLLSVYTSKDESTFYSCQSQLYAIFAIIAKSSSSYLSHNQRRLLEPAIEYMQEHLFDPSFSIQEMESQTDISDKYFRTLFAAYYGMSPQRYMINERIQLAKTILAESPGTAMQVVADEIGYADALYFSRLFKKETGESPTQYARRMMEDPEPARTSIPRAGAFTPTP